MKSHHCGRGTGVETSLIRGVVCRPGWMDGPCSHFTCIMSLFAISLARETAYYKAPVSFRKTFTVTVDR